MSQTHTTTLRKILHHPSIQIGMIYLTFTSFTLSASSSPLLTLLAAAVLMPASLYFYGYLHNHYHSSSVQKRNLKYELIGILMSAPLGMSWAIYKKHHGNHHKFNNAEGDYAQTVDRKGRLRNGGEYLWSTAVWPSLIQFVPYVSYVFMKKENRTLIHFFDESLRVGLRIAVLMLFGLTPLLVVLAIQTLFLTYLFYINYLQHVGCTSPSAHTWSNPIFNFITNNLGLHDEHHRNGYASPERLAELSGHRGVHSLAYLNPLSFLVFLVDPNQLVPRKQAQAGES